MAKTEKPPLKKRGPNGGARPGAGRPAFVPTDAERKQVEAMSGYGLPIEQIAVLVRDGIHVETLRAHFGAELLSGKAKANSGVGRTLFQKAMSGDTAAMIWWSKTQMRWKDVQHHELTGKDGGPIETVSLDVTKLSTDALAQIMAARTGGSDE
jgi:hypothetical protein